MSARTQDYPYPRPQQPYYAPKKGLGIASMVVGIVAIVLSFIPLIGFLSFVLGPIAIILGIIAIIKKTGKGQGIAGIITGALGFVIVAIGTLIFGAAVVSFDEEMQNLEGEDAAVSDEAEVEAAEEQAEEEAEGAEAQEEEGQEPTPAEDPRDEGSRENPLPIGETVSNDEWEVTINSVTLNADDQIAAANQFNDPAPEGSSYALVDVSMTYLGDDSDTAVFGTDIAYVSGGGETSNAYEQPAVAPDALDTMRELYNGGTEQGNVALAIPDGDDEGALRVRLGFISTEDHFFETQ